MIIYIAAYTAGSGLNLAKYKITNKDWPSVLLIVILYIIFLIWSYKN